ncbi:MAG: FAD-dependent oxidoreductase, partial [Vicinamibacterales bacterium]|nr:FAD-dependent oxidoreductase [Vicinamibacterales bacterium]
ITLIRVDPGRPFPFVAGQAVMAGLATQHVRRPYSIASSPGQVRTTGLLDLLAGHDDSGALGRHLAPLGPGSLLGIAGPLGRFALPSRLTRRHVVLVAGGTGIAPLRAMLWSALERTPPPAIELVFSARSPADLAFHAEFRLLHERGALRYAPTITRRAGPSWTGRRGRIDREMLAQTLGPSPVCLVCGSASFTSDMIALLRSLGVRRTSIRREEY